MADLHIKRMSKDMNTLLLRPPWGISCHRVEDDKLLLLEASMMGPRDSPYEEGTFQLTIEFTTRYPFEPPLIKFKTSVYHPNIDKGGRICLDLIKMPPEGGWRPTMTLEGVLLAVQALLGCPNPDDPLEVDIALQYKHDREGFNAAAREHTRKHAV